MLDQTRHRYFPVFIVLIMGLGFTWAALTLLTMGRAPPVAHAQGDLRYVGTGGMDAGNDCTDPAAPCATLQHAVDVAGPGDEIRVAGGRYMNIHIRLAPAGYSGPAAITQVVYLGKSLVPRGGYTLTAFAGPLNPEVYPTTLDAEGQGRVLFMAGVITVTGEGLHVIGGDAAGLKGTGFYGYDAEGGVYVATATTVISHSGAF
jgi:hypothetical protein